jgi:hypothetical protein
MLDLARKSSVLSTKQSLSGLGCPSVIEHLPSMLNAPGLIPSTGKKKKEDTLSPLSDMIKAVIVYTWPKRVHLSFYVIWLSCWQFPSYTFPERCPPHPHPVP